MLSLNVDLSMDTKRGRIFLCIFIDYVTRQAERILGMSM